MDHTAEMHRCFLELDVPAVRQLWKYLAPHLPQAASDLDALVSLHYGRTTLDRMPFKLRAYSHRWLCDNGYPSGLPDNLKPKAERLYPRVVDAVGISANASSRIFKPIIGIVQTAMADAVEVCYADKQTEPTFVKARMHEEKLKTIKKLLGRVRNDS